MDVIDPSKLAIGARLIKELADGELGQLLRITGIHQEKLYISALFSIFHSADEATIDHAPYYPLQSLIKLTEKNGALPEKGEDYNAVLTTLTSLLKFFDVQQKLQVCEVLLRDDSLSKHVRDCSF
jgi:hypothetical protein